jgi:hypothetical protein
MKWWYDANTMRTADGHELIRRTQLEEAAERLWRVGIRNRFLLIDILSSLSGLSIAEVRFTLELYFANADSSFSNPLTRLTPAGFGSLSAD